MKEGREVNKKKERKAVTFNMWVVQQLCKLWYKYVGVIQWLALYGWHIVACNILYGSTFYLGQYGLHRTAITFLNVNKMFLFTYSKKKS